MPEDLDLPDWVSEPRSSLPHRDEVPTRRSELRRLAEEQRRAAAHRASQGHAGHHEPRATACAGDARPTTRSELRALSRAEARQATYPEERAATRGELRGAEGRVRDDARPMTRAERRRQEQEAQRRRQPTRRGQLVEMVPPDLPEETRLRSRRHGQEPRRRRSSRRTLARRRGLAALALTSSLAFLLWTLWPSGESSGPGRDTADLTAAAVSRDGSDPTAAAEEPPPSPTIAPSPGRSIAPESGTGKVAGVAMPTIAAPTVNPTRTIRVGLKVERGAGVDSAEAARIVADTLGDARGWQTDDRVRFRAVGPEAMADGDVDITIVLASPTLTDKLCRPLRTNGQVSCFNLRTVVLNVRRWTEGVPGYGNDLAAYRQYMVNHEIGHGLYHGHVECPRKGALAPIMLQQTKGLDGCRPNAWPTLH